MKIGIISLAHLHAYSYIKQLLQHPLVDWVGITDRDEKRRSEASAEYGVAAYATTDELLEQDPDGIIVTSENARHPEDVRAASTLGVPILCEKPLAASVADARGMIADCAENGAELNVCYPVRYLSTVRLMREKLASGGIGEIEHITASNHGSFPGGWFADPELSGGGALMDHTVHVADIVHWMTGAHPERVVAVANRMREGLEVEDCALLSVRWDQDFDLSLDASWSRNENFPTWGDVKFKIYGTEGVLEVDALNQMLAIYSDRRRGSTWDYWGDNMDYYLLDDFLSSIAEGSGPVIPAEEGLVSLQVVDMAYSYLQKSGCR